jgi:WD40 repeat protein
MVKRIAAILCSMLLAGLARGVPAPVAPADESLVPPRDGKPILQLDAGGPMAAVTALAFAPDGKTLYIGGYDKIVRVWVRGKDGRFTQQKTLHIPIGPGMFGLINAVAVSPDGQWLAAAGSGVVRESAGFGANGLFSPVRWFSPEMEKDWGAIYLFDLKKDGVTPLRGHREPVLGLQFLPKQTDTPQLLVSVGPKGKGAMTVHLWDADAGKELAMRDDLPSPGGNEPPGLAAWHTGPKATDVGVAVLLAGDKDTPGRLNYWNVGKNGRPQSTQLEHWLFTNTAAFQPGKQPYGGVLFTGGLWPKKEEAKVGAYLRGWPLTDEGPQRNSDLMEALGEVAAPKTLVLVPKEGGESELAASIEELPGAAGAHRLVLIGRTQAGGFGEVKASADLWSGRSPVCVTAASPDGTLLAVAGDPDHSVSIFAIADLLKNKSTAFQKIAGVGALVREVGFVRNKDKVQGLLLREDRGDGKPGEEWVLDGAAHSLQQGRDGWADDAPDIGTWSVTPGADFSFIVSQGKQEVGVVHMKAGNDPKINPFIKAYRLLPPSKPLNKALLAVAYIEQGVSYLELFDVAADHRVRALTGHVGAVRYLAFSGDGRFLASAGDDHTVAVWSLTDLTKEADKGGGLAGFAVKQKGKDLVVSAKDDDALSPANKKALQGVNIDDVVDGMVKDKAVKPLQSQKDLNDVVWDVKPGDAIVLRIGGADVSLTADQGEGERKPLFTFFMRNEVKDRFWLAWSPSGPYDTVDRAQAEDLIGWHSNTGKASAPVEFAPAAQYRKESYRPELLKYLLEAGNLADALKQWETVPPVPKPGMGLRLEAPKTQFPEAQGRVQMHGQPANLTLRADVYGILPAKIKQVRWRFDAGDWQDFDAQTDLAFTADLAKLKWQAGSHELSMLLETVEGQQAEYVKRLVVDYAPAARPARPEIAGPKEDLIKVGAPLFTFKAEVNPGKNGPADPKVRTTVRLNNGEAKETGSDVSEKFTLATGDNFIEVRAENDGAAPAALAEETATRRWVVRYDIPDKIASPTIFLESVASAPDKPQDGKALVVHDQEVRIHGRITSPEPLKEATCDGRPLTGFAANQRELAFDEPVVLKGVDQEQKVEFVAEHDKGDATRKTLVLKFQPRAAGLAFDQDAPPPPPTVKADTEKIDLKGRIDKVKGDASAATVGVSLNGKPVKGVKLKDGRLDASLSLDPGDNLIEVTVSNPFDSRTETLHCYRARPPVVKSVAPSVKGDAAELTAVVETPADRPLSSVRVANDSVPDPSEQTLTKQGAEVGGTQTWKVVVRGVLLKEGKNNKLSLWARNEDGESMAPVETMVAVAPKAPAAPPPPTIEVLDPRAPENVVETPQGELTFRVAWHGPPGEIGVQFDDRDKANTGVAASPPGPDGAVTYQTKTLPLRSGANIIRVTARGAGGKTESDRFTLFYKPHVAVLRLTGWSANGQGQPQQLPRDEFDRPVFPGQDKSQVWVHGEVEWPDETDPVLRQDPPPRVRVWVNDFEQFDVPLGPRKKAVREFRAELRLNNTANHVEIGSSDVKVANAAFGVDCAKPARDQRLHVFIVAPSRTDEGKVTDEVLTAFQARHVENEQFDTPAFKQGRMYGPVIKLAQREDVFGAVENMKGAINGGADALNDVIVVYFLGQQLLTDQEHFLLTGETRMLLPNLKPGDKLEGTNLEKVKESALTCDKFRELLADVHGAKLVLLDATDPVGGKDATKRVEDLLGKAGEQFPRIATLDYVVLGGPAPQNGRLVDLLRKSLGQASSLRDLTGQGDAEARGGADRMFRFYVPDGLQAITLGRPGQ